MADTSVTADAEAVFPEEQTGVERGWGGALRIGSPWDLWLFELTPEIGASYHVFGGSADAHALRGMAGLRLGLGFILEPSVFARLGVARFRSPAEEAIASHTGVGYDLGVGLDFTLIPKLDLGAHAAWSGAGGNADEPRLRWLALGGHVTVQFDD